MKWDATATRGGHFTVYNLHKIVAYLQKRCDFQIRMKRKYESMRTGVIGIGSMGQNHARIYSEISNLVGVSDLDEKQGNEIAKKLGTVGYLDQLTRIAVGDHKISESISINEFENQWKSINS